MHEYIRSLKSQSQCQLSPKRRVLDLESEVMTGPASIPTGGNIFHWIFLFSRSKSLCHQYWHYCHSCAFRKTLLIGFIFSCTIAVQYMHILIDLLDEETMDTFVCEQETFNISCPANKKIEIIPGRTVSTIFLQHY